MKLLLVAAPSHIAHTLAERAPSCIEAPDDGDFERAFGHDVAVVWISDEGTLNWLARLRRARTRTSPRLIAVCTREDAGRALRAGADDVAWQGDDEALKLRLQVASAALHGAPSWSAEGNAEPVGSLLERLEKNEELTRRILEAMPGGIVHVTSDGAVVRANAEAARFLGLRLDELTQRYTFDFEARTLDERGQPCTVDDYPVTRALVTGEAQPRKLIGVQRPDGVTAWAVFSAVPVKDPQTGSTTGAVVTFLDITERLAAERTLAESEERYRQVAENSPDPIAIVQGGSIAYVNDAAVRLFGFDCAAAMRSVSLWTLVRPESRGTLETYMAERARDQSRDTLEERLLTRDGTPIDVELLVAPLNYEGQPALAFVARDIRKRKRAEEELERLRAQVTHGQKLESLGLLAGGIAHDFNNLLAAILGNASLAKIRLPAESPAASSVAAIETAARRAADLTGQMLAYAGRGTVTFDRLELSKLVREMSELLATVISKKATLEMNLAEHALVVEGDAAQVRQVVMNLIINASDALADSAGRVSLTTGVRGLERDELAHTYVNDDLPAGSYAFVEVKDTGMGMDEVTAARVFDPFFSTKTTGRGLGLASTLGIVRRHRGAVQLESEPGRGTTFRIYFPVAAGRRPLSEPPERAMPSMQGATVLVVDDEPMVRQVTAAMLREFGYDALEADCGTQGVEMYARQSGQIDVVVLDMTMPDLTGGEVLEALRRIRQDVRVVLCSGYTEDDVDKHVATEHVAAFLQKPYNATALVRAVERALNG